MTQDRLFILDLAFAMYQEWNKELSRWEGVQYCYNVRKESNIKRIVFVVVRELCLLSAPPPTLPFQNILLYAKCEYDKDLCL